MQNNTEKIFQGWFQAIFAALIYALITTSMQYGILSLLIPQLSLTNNWSGNVVSLFNSLYQGSIAVFASVFTLLSKKCAIKKIMVWSGFVGIAACLAMTALQSYPVAIVALTVPLGACSSMSALIPTTIIVNNWFNRNKALPLSIVMATGGIGGFVFPLIYQKTLDAFGSIGCISVSILCIAISIGLVIFLVRETPEEIGEIPDGIAWTRQHPEEAQPEQKKQADSQAPEAPSIRKLIRMPALYFITLVVWGSRFVLSSVCGYLVLFGAEKNLGDVAVFISVFNIVGFVGRLSAGLSDKLHWSSKSLATVSTLSMLAGSILLCMVSGPGLLLPGMILCGFGFGLMTSLNPILVADYFDHETFSLAYSTIYTLAGIGAFLIPILSMLVYSFAGSYICVFVMDVVVTGLSLILCLLFKKKA